MNEFIPQPDYEGLLKQCRALVSLVRTLEEQGTIYCRLLNEERNKNRHVSQEELDSERAANQQLTDKCETLEYCLRGATGLISDERQRQLAVEGWTSEHDDEHEKGEMAYASIAYITATLHRLYMPRPDMNHVREMYWPWEKEWWKPSKNPVRNLVKAGALIAAEIDRLQREEAKS